MHKFAFIFTLLFSATAAAQLGYFTLGYGGNVANMDGINKVVTNYNEARPWLQNKMSAFGYLDGVTISLGGAFDHAWTDIEYGFRSQKNRAWGTDTSGNFNTQELKVRNGSFILNLGYLATESRFPFAAGLRMDLGGLIAKTRVYGESSPKGKLEQIGFKDITLKIGPTVKIFVLRTDQGILISGCVYYVWSLYPQNVTLMDVELNDSFFFADDPQFGFNPHTFGFNVNVGLGGRY